MAAQKPIALNDRVAVITGSTRGIGRTIAETFARAGAKIVVSSSKAEAVERATSELRAQGWNCIGVPCDVTQLNQVQNLFEQARSKWGKVDIWVNNAAISGPYALSLEMPIQTWERVIQTNVLGTYYGCATVIPHMVERRYGKIINMSGGGTTKAQRFLTAYSTSKAAVVRLTDGLARDYRDYRKFLAVNVLAPGIVPTDMTLAGEAIGKAAEALKVLPRVLRIWGTSADEAAQLALRMVSRETDGVSGKIYSVLPQHRIWFRLVQTAVGLR